MPRVRFYRNEAQFAAKWMLNYLIKDQDKADSIDLKIYIRHMSDWGRMHWFDDDKKFVIVLDASVGRRASLLTLAHEIIHVYQFLSGKRRNMKSGVYWKRRKILNDINDEDFLTISEYFALPWEAEAYRLQARVSRAYQRYWKSCQNTITTNRSS